ncbi:MAG: hypothetical protein HW388_153 [Dehalococcoidia bacterium]|nr:hypothetical protein [Dehalococcoidia bacterium]
MGILRTLLRSAFVLLVSTILLFSKDSLSLSPVEELAKAHLYSLVQWEMENFLDKGLYRARLLLTGNDLGAQARTDLVLEYFRLGNQEGDLKGRIERATYSSPTDDNYSLDALKKDLARVEKARGSMRNRVEEVLEGQIDAVIAREKLPLGGPLSSLGVHLPPVDFRFDSSPRVLVVSPRDRIEMAQGILLRPDITLEEMEALERRVMEEENLSALVEGTGEVATYPSVISPGFSLRDALSVAAHEWLHHYLFFRPLGQTYGKNGDMTSLNETLAGIFGQEIGGLVYRRFYEAPVALRVSRREEGFDFRAEMHKTRLQVEQLLKEGRVEEAEEYMEQQRRLFAEQGYLIRKLNQAYFAFHGTYGDDPSSISPIFDQLSALRAASPSLGEFVRQVSSVSSYTDFLELLDGESGMGGIFPPP